jgi:hypothetical protein
MLAGAKTPEGMKVARERLTNTYRQVSGSPAPEVSDENLRARGIDWVTDYMIKSRAAGGQGRIANPAKLMEALRAGSAH